MLMECNIILTLNIVTDVSNPEEREAVMCLAENLAQQVADDLTDEKTVVAYEYKFDCKEVG